MKMIQRAPPVTMVRAAVLCVGVIAFFVLYATRHAPSQARKAIREYRHLSGRSDAERRAEMFFEDGAHVRLARRYFAFLDEVVRRTPDRARVAITGLPSNSLYKFAHYYLYPRHPFRGDDLSVDELRALRVGYVAEFPEVGHTFNVRPVE